MTTNVLLIIIIVLLALGLFFQFFQFLALFLLPDRLVDSFLDFFAEDIFERDEKTTVNVETGKRERPPNFKGFGNSQKSKRSWSRRADKTSTETAETKVE
jgi:flagellar basal body-associated protein FliL